MRGPWFGFNKVVDSDTTNFKDLVDEIVDKFPCGYGDVVKLFYFCADSKSNIEIHSDQDLMNMFAKHKTSKCCRMSIAYHKPDVDPPEIPLWDNVEIPCSPSMPGPSYVEPSKATQLGTVTEPYYDMVDIENSSLPSYVRQIEYVGVDEDLALYSDIEPTSHANVDTSEKNDEDYDPGSNSESDFMTDSDTDAEVDETTKDIDAEVDETIKDTLPSHIPEVAYNKDDPPMEVGSIYPNISEFKLALATHAIKNEFEYNIEKSEPGKYRAYCTGHVDGCKWRIHVSRTKGDQTTVQVISLCIFCHLYFIHISDFIILICRSRRTLLLISVTVQGGVGR